MELTQEWLDRNLWWIVLLAVWELIWKGQALWRAARKGDTSWFVVLLIVNTVGLLPLAYLFVISKDDQEDTSQ